MLAVLLPTYAWFGPPAINVLTQRDNRVTADNFYQLLGRHGFADIRSTYWNTLLFPLMVLRRKLLGGASSDVMVYPAPLERLFRALVALETRVLAAGWALPFGGSVLVRAVKHA